MKQTITTIFSLFCLLAFSPAQAVNLQESVNGMTVKLSVGGDSVQVGSNTAKVTVLDASGQAITNARVKLYYGMMAMAGMPPMNYKTKLGADGSQYSGPVDFKMKGHWNLRVKIKTKDGKSHAVKMGLMVK